MHVFANLWDSGKSAALELEPKTFLILYLFIISFKDIYSLEFMHEKEDGQTDGQTGLKIIYIENYLNVRFCQINNYLYI